MAPEPARAHRDNTRAKHEENTKRIRTHPACPPQCPRQQLALEWPWGRNEVAIGCLLTRFGVTLTSHGVTCAVSRFYFCFLLSLHVGFAMPSDVGCWLLDVLEYTSPPLPPSAWSAGTLDKPWTYPGTIEPPQSSVFIRTKLPSTPGPGNSPPR